MTAQTVFGVDVTQVTFDEATYYVPDFAAHRMISQRILSRQYSEPQLHDLVSRVMAARPGSMIHAGTFFGDMLPSFSRKCPGTVYAFEPVIETYLLAHETVEVNRLTNVILMHAGLGRAAGSATLLTHDGDVHRGGGSRVIADGSGQQRTPIVAIDQFEIPDLTLIQLDVEGSEEAALQGAADTIARTSPVIVVEDNRANNCAALLASMGYQPHRKIHHNQLYLTDSLAEQLDL